MAYIKEFSPLTEAIVLFTWAAPFWHMMMVQLQAKVSRNQTIAVSGIMLAWSFWAFFAIKYNFDDLIFQGFAGKPFVYLLLAALLTWIYKERLIGNGVSQHLLIGLQLFRVIGMLFVFEYSRGVLPSVFANPAGWGDLLVAVIALIVLIKYHDIAIPAKAVWTVAIVGLLDFASAFTFGFLSSETPLQMLSFDFPNRVIEYPTGLIPLFLVPYAVMAHILSLAQLWKEQKKD